MTDNPMRPTETGSVSQPPVWSQDPIGRAMQVGAGHRAAKVPNARWRRRQWRPERTKERQLQARPIYRGGRGHAPLAS